MSLSRWLIPMLAVVALAPAHAWNPEGHRVVGALAGRLLAGSHAAAEVGSLLGSLSLADASVWADCVKGVDPDTLQYERGRYPECVVFETAQGEAEMVDFVRRNARNCVIKPGEEVCHRQYHYADVAIQRDAYRPGLIGTRDDDVVAAIVATTRVLKGDPAPAPFRIAGKREALLLLTHYVGDIHQPLHVGAVYLDAQGNRVDPDTRPFEPGTATRGANSIRVLPGTRQNLHATWDAIPRRMTEEHLSSAWIAAAAAVPPTRGPELAWPAQWASESVREARLALDGLTFGPRQGGHWTVRLPAGYSRSMSARKKSELTRAGARLAQLLRDIWP
jgi:hypothetical protein